jgi:hypothetical protein
MRIIASLEAPPMPPAKSGYIGNSSPGLSQSRKELPTQKPQSYDAQYLCSLDSNQVVNSRTCGKRRKNVTLGAASGVNNVGVKWIALP